ncbi:AvrD family protein [Streptomyces sp. NPDC048258]|uniref:AvrD family protein n=1 Tax=Streptomyces sp. NPDC048258 TaxID=3365527 RepID=UPI0037171D7E
MSTTTARRGHEKSGSIEDHLGPGDRRFFGEGFKRGVHRIREIAAEYDAEGAGHITGRASVAYPADWSRKGDTDQRPHLSTVDILVLGVRLTETYLAHARGLDAGQCAGSWLRRVRIRAGSAPVEEELADFGVRAHAAEVRPSPDAADRLVTAMDCRIGTLTARIEIDHPAGRAPGAPFAGPLADLRGEDGQGPFGAGYKHRSQRIEDVSVSPGEGEGEGKGEYAACPVARARVRLVSRSAEAAATAAGHGIEGRRQPALSLIDSFVVGLQLGQVLLYRLDGGSRAESGTLWMRTAVLEAHGPPPPLVDGRAVDAAAHLADSALLRTSSGDVWRRADVVGTLGGLRLRCSVAHRLPRT